MAWTGRISREEVLECMDQAQVVVLPSYYPEGVPRSLIEAAAKGKALITTDTPGCRDVVAHGVNGYRYPSRMPGAWPPGCGSSLPSRSWLKKWAE